MKKVVIDSRLTGRKNAGIGRYIENLISALMKSKDDRQTFFLVEIRPSIRHYSFSEQLLMPSILSKTHPDLVHVPHFNVPLQYNDPFVVTIHDLLWHDQVGTNVTTLPAWLYGVKYLGYRLVMNHAISDSKAIIVPSHWVEKKILERFPNAAGKIHVIYEGVSDAYAETFKGSALPQQGRALLDRYGLKQNQFLIYTGSLYPHKNVDLVLNVLKHCNGLKFVVACARNVFWEKFREKVKRLGLEEKVVLAGFVPDEELVKLYHHALAFVFPSFSEGFGLPGLEAMASGCPVLSSTAGALPEIYADAAEYFDPKSERQLMDGIEKMMVDKKYKEGLIKKGKERAKQFTWEKCAEETCAVYENCLRLRSGQ